MRVAYRQPTLHLLLLVGAFLILLPLLWMLTTSLKSPGDVHIPPYLIPVTFDWSNYSRAFAADDFPRFYVNSAVMTGGIVAGQVLLSSAAGYAFARLRFPGRGLLFGLVLATMMMPVYVTLVPSYLIVRTLGWLDSYTGLIVPRLVSPFGIFLMRQYYLSLSSDFEEAAMIDGASRLRVWWSVALPMSVPALATIGIFAFLFSWNDLLWPLIITTDPDLRTVQLGLAMFSGRYGTQWTLLAAGSLVATLPAIIAYLVGQRWLVRGIALGAGR
jgi:multiple sugar transport system permease protein